MGSCYSTIGKRYRGGGGGGGGGGAVTTSIITSSSRNLFGGAENGLHRIPERMFVNGASTLASLFTQQGKKGTNQDAMLVWEENNKLQLDQVEGERVVFCEELGPEEGYEKSLGALMGFQCGEIHC